MKMLKSYLFVVVLIIVAAIAFSSCSKGGKLTSITVIPADTTVIPGTSLQYQAQGHLSDNANYFLATSNWSSLTPSVGPIEPTTGFLVTGISGTTLITASDPYSNFTGTTLLTVDLLSSVTVTPTLPSMTRGLTHQFTATGFLATIGTQTVITQDLTTFPTLSWTSSDPAIATVVNTPGVAGTGVVTIVTTTTGTATIQASIVTSDGTGTITKTGSTIITVTATPLSSLAIYSGPTNSTSPPKLATGETVTFSATGTYADSPQDTRDWTLSAIWSSSNTAVATIDFYDPAAAVAAGTTTITVTAVAPGVTTITATDPITSLASSATLTVQ